MADQPSDDELAHLLQVVQDGDVSDAPVDNGGIAAALGLSLETVAEQLQAAKDRSLIWGMRSGQQPAPWFTDLELTVQGRRFLKPGRRAST